MHAVTNTGNRTQPPIPRPDHSEGNLLIPSGPDNNVDTPLEQNTLPRQGSLQEGAVRQAIANAKQQSIIHLETKTTVVATDPTLTEAENSFKNQLSSLASDKQQFHNSMKTVYGDRYDAKIVENLRLSTLAGDFSFLPKAQFTSSESLGGNHAAYAADTGTIYLNDNLKNDPEKLLAYYGEEAAHHIDTLFGKGDAKGDEGEIFRRLLAGESLNQSQIDAIQTENDHGTIIIDGNTIEVEFGFFSSLAKPFKSIGRALEKGVKNLAYTAINTAFKIHTLTTKLFPILEKVDEYLADHEWFQKTLTAAASFFAGPLGASIASAHIAFTQGADAEDILKAGAFGAVTSYAASGLGAGTSSLTAQEFAKTQLTEELKEQVMNKIGDEIGSERLRQLALGIISGNGIDLTSAFSQDNLSNILKQEAKNHIKEEVISRIAEEIDYPPLRDLLSNWITNGARIDDITGALETFRSKVSHLNKDQLTTFLQSQLENISDPTLREIASDITSGSVDVNQAVNLFNKENVTRMLEHYLTEKSTDGSIDASDIGQAALNQIQQHLEQYIALALTK